MNPEYHRVVVKLGTSTLTAGTAHLSPPRILDLVRQMAELQTSGVEVILVTSGAITAGRERLNFPQLSKNIPEKQMLSAVGQPRLMALYEQLFGLYGIVVSQVLLTRADMTLRKSYLNSRNTLLALINQKVIPIVNENDTVATEEIRVGDNDNLSALVANVVEADLLALLTDQSGLFTADPRQSPEVELIPEITGKNIPEEIWQAAGGTVKGIGTGGMLTKLQAADLARRSGTKVVIARGSSPDILLKIVHGEQVGTMFTPVVTALEARKRYILAGGNAVGTLYADLGAVNAIIHGKSLLPVGLSKIEGVFDRGDIVRVNGQDGREIAIGLVNYSSEDLSQLAGKQSMEIEKILGYAYGEEVIHRNNMVLL